MCRFRRCGMHRDVRWGGCPNWRRASLVELEFGGESSFAEVVCREHSDGDTSVLVRESLSSLKTDDVTLHGDVWGCGELLNLVDVAMQLRKLVVGDKPVGVGTVPVVVQQTNEPAPL